MDWLLSLTVEIISELVGILIISAYLFYQKRIQDKKYEKLRGDLALEKLNNVEVDEVLLINDMSYLNQEHGLDKFNKSSIVLCKDSKGFYNIVVKNKYGSEGTIK